MKFETFLSRRLPSKSSGHKSPFSFFSVHIKVLIFFFVAELPVLYGSYFDAVERKDFVVNWVTRFLSAFDYNRTRDSLLNVYAENALFSLTCMFDQRSLSTTFVLGIAKNQQGGFLLDTTTFHHRNSNTGLSFCSASVGYDHITNNTPVVPVPYPLFFHSFFKCLVVALLPLSVHEDHSLFASGSLALDPLFCFAPSPGSLFLFFLICVALN